MLPVGILNKAIEVAKSSSYYPYKIGCVIFNKKRIISSGFNAVRSFSLINDKYKKYIESCHAEQAAIMRVRNKRKLWNASMIVIRINHYSEMISMAKPCENCMKSIRFFHIRDLYYSDSNGQIILEKLTYGKQ